MGWPVNFGGLRIVYKVQGQGLMLDDSVAKPAEECHNQIFNPEILWCRSFCWLPKTILERALKRLEMN